MAENRRSSVAPMKELVELEEGWEFIDGEISKLKRILDGSSEGFCGGDHAMLYTKIYDMCTQKPPHNYILDLYQRYSDLMNDYVSQTVVPSLRDLHDEYLLRELMKRWANQKLMVKWMHHFFAYLDRHPCNKVPQKVRAVGMSCFVKLAFETALEKAIQALLKLIEQEREGEQIDRSLLKTVLDMFIDVGMQYNYHVIDTTAVKEESSLQNDYQVEDIRMEMVDYYQGSFEGAMLEDTANYYSRKAAIWVPEDSFPDYMLKVDDCLRKEKERASRYLQSSSQQKLLDEVWNQLLSPHNVAILLQKEDKGCLALLKEDKVDDLSKIYHLLSKPSMSQFLNLAVGLFKQYVIDEGIALVKQAEAAANTLNTAERKETAGLHEHNFVWKVIGLHDKFMAYVSWDGCFNNNSLFRMALHDSLEIIYSKSVAGNSTAELFSNFCDKILRKGGVDKLSHEAIEAALNKVLRALAYIGDKDLFGELYRRKLGRRLLGDASASDEHERSMISKLKKQCGAQYTSKMEGMITDMALAKERQISFKNYLDDSNPIVNTAGVDLNVTVLTTGFWPSYKSPDVNLPQELAKCVDVYKEFYQTQTRHKRLSWVSSMGTCNITGKFEKMPIELVVNTYQACVLMLFNTSDRLSCSEIVSQLNLQEADVGRLLHSLSCGKYKILTKEPNTKMVSRSDVFEFNSMFTDKMRRIKIPLPPMDEKKKAAEEVNIDRKYTVDAAIVRIMKSRKVLEYQVLVTECVEQLRTKFKPDIRLIKKRIEDLISRDYLDRDNDNRNVLKYVA